MKDSAIKIGLLGLGTVGQGLVEGIQGNRHAIEEKLGKQLVIKQALVRDIDKERLIQDIGLTQNPEDILNDPEIDVIVEVMGNEHPTYAYVKQALRNGKHVVTANKLLLAKHGAELQGLARHYGVCLLYEGSVLGGIPILRTIQHGLSGDEVEEVRGILNGTTNFILTQMVKLGQDYKTALKIAQEAGYAESDPTMDVSGLDAACKLVILCRECFGKNIRIEDIKILGIQKITVGKILEEQAEGKIPKLIAEAKVVFSQSPSNQNFRERIEAKVGVEWIDNKDVLYQVSGVDNALVLKTKLVGELFWKGPGAGGLATGGAILSDVLEVANRVVSERNFQNLTSLDKSVIIKS